MDEPTIELLVSLAFAFLVLGVVLFFALRGNRQRRKPLPDALMDMPDGGNDDDFERRQE